MTSQRRVNVRIVAIVATTTLVPIAFLRPLGVIRRAKSVATEGGGLIIGVVLTRIAPSAMRPFTFLGPVGFMVRT